MLTQQDAMITMVAVVEGWVREEGLGTVTTLQFMDMPADQPAMVESFLEQTRAEVNPIKLAFLRWKLQAQLLKVCHMTA